MAPDTHLAVHTSRSDLRAGVKGPAVASGQPVQGAGDGVSPWASGNTGRVGQLRVGPLHTAIAIRPLWICYPRHGGSIRVGRAQAARGSGLGESFDRTVLRDSDSNPERRRWRSGRRRGWSRAGDERGDRGGGWAWARGRWAGCRALFGAIAGLADGVSRHDDPEGDCCDSQREDDSPRDSTHRARRRAFLERGRRAFVLRQSAGILPPCAPKDLKHA
jgi:hypothetical protein